MNKQRMVLFGLCGWLLGAVSGFAEQRAAYTYDYRYNSDEAILLLETLQGIVNRDAPNLYFMGTSSMSYNETEWRDVYEQQYGFAFTSIFGMAEVVDTFRGYLNGAVLYDSTIDGARWVAAMVGGLDDLLPVPANSGWEDSLGLDVVVDLSGMFTNSVHAYDWALDEVMPRCNRTIAHAPACGDVDGKYIGWGFLGIDYVIANQGFIVNLGCVDEDSMAFGRIIDGTPDQKAMYSRVLGALDSPATIFGYGEPELDWFHFIGQYGCTYLHWGENLSFHAAVEASNPEFSQTTHFTPADVTVDRDKYYVAFMTSEGDSMKGPLPFYFDSWFDPARGSVPMNWAINPEMVRFPAMLEYYYDTATSNDYFVAMQVFNFEMNNLDEFADKYASLMDLADLRVMGGDYASLSDDVGSKWQFFDRVKPLGAVDALFNGRPQGYNYLMGQQKTPAVATGWLMTYWERAINGWGTDWQEMWYGSPEEKEELIQAAVDEIEKEAAANNTPSLLVLYSDIHLFDRTPELHREIADRLDPEKFKVVRLDEGFSMLRSLREYTPAPDDPNLQLWLKADEGVAHTGDGTGVMNWTNQATSAVAVGNATSALGAPVFTANSEYLGNQPSIELNGVDQGFVVNDGAAHANTLLQGDFSIFAVIREHTFEWGIPQVILANSANVFATQQSTVNDGTDGYLLYQKQGGNWGTVSSTRGSISQTRSYVVSVTHGGTGNGQTDLHINGGIDDNSEAVPDVSFLGTVNIGYQAKQGPMRFFDGEIAELLVYNTVLSDVENANIRRHLGHKYGIDRVFDPSSGLVIYKDDFEGTAGDPADTTIQETGSFADYSTNMTFDGSGHIHSANSSGEATYRTALDGQSDFLTDDPNNKEIKYTAIVRTPINSEWIIVGFQQDSSHSIWNASANAGPYLKLQSGNATIIGGSQMMGSSHEFAGEFVPGDILSIEFLYNIRSNTVDLVLDGRAVASAVPVIHYDDGITNPVIGHMVVSMNQQPAAADGGAYIDRIEVELNSSIVPPKLPQFFDPEIVGDMLRLTVSAEGDLGRYSLQGTPDLTTGSWAPVAHSATGTNAFIVTNLSYSGSLGSDAVIYVETTNNVFFYQAE